MTKKLMLAFFLVSFLLVTSIALAGERPSAGPVVVPSKCDCLKKDKVQISPDLRPEVLAEDLSFMTIYRDCRWFCDSICLEWWRGHCYAWGWECVYFCDGLPARPHN
jgi:hypothetical protein